MQKLRVTKAGLGAMGIAAALACVTLPAAAQVIEIVPQGPVIVDPGPSYDWRTNSYYQQDLRPGYGGYVDPNSGFYGRRYWNDPPHSAAGSGGGAGGDGGSGSITESPGQ